MTATNASCPNCAAAIFFGSSSINVVVCGRCSTAVGRAGDGGFESLGVFPDLNSDASPLYLGARGFYQGYAFELAGVVRNRHERGGTWDEWHAVFDNGWVGRLHEAQGRFQMTFFQPLQEGVFLPGFDSLAPGAPAGIPGRTAYVVTEKGAASAVAAEGQIPFLLAPGQTRRFADLAASPAVFATIDYRTEPPRLFVGRDVTLAELRIPPRASVAQPVGACPKCGAPLGQFRPDLVALAACASCAALIEFANGVPNLVATQANKPSFMLQIGRAGVLPGFANGAEMRIVGALQRSVTLGGTKYFWEEYLLHADSVGFRWLAQSDRSWSFVEPADAAGIVESEDKLGPEPARLTFREREFFLFQTAEATVEFVAGQFYWRVLPGEKVLAADYVAPPFQLSRESSAGAEVVWSLATWVDRRVVAKAFGEAFLPGPDIPAPNEPYRRNGVIRASFVMLLLFLTAAALVSAFVPTPPRQQLGANESYLVAPAAGSDETVTVVAGPFRLKGGRSAYVSVRTDLDYESEADFDVELLAADPVANRTESPRATILGYASSDYSIASTYVEVPVDGDYQLRATGKWKQWGTEHTLTVEAYQSEPVPTPWEFVLAPLFLLPPIFLFLGRLMFEVRRWNYAMFRRPRGSANILSGLISGD